MACEWGHQLAHHPTLCLRVPLLSGVPEAWSFAAGDGVHWENMYETLGGWGWDEGETAVHALQEDAGTDATSVEFLSADAIPVFLNKRERRPDSFLQKFVVPKLDHNTSIQCVWTPFMCLVNRRKNVNNLYDTRFSLHDKCVTHEGVCAPPGGGGGRCG